MKLFSVDGRVAVITGASSGIGQHLAIALAEAGARVVLIARREESITNLAKSLNGHAHPCDLLSIENFNVLADSLSQVFGPPDIVINAAGINFREPIEDVTADSWHQTINLNLTVPFFLSRALVGHMAGSGSIINIASLQSERAFANSAPYGASKGGIAQLTRAMAEAWSSRGIRANALAPGFFPTALTQAVFDDEQRAAANARQTCIGRNGELDDLVGPALFLCSDASTYVTGQILYVDGGFTAK